MKTETILTKRESEVLMCYVNGDIGKEAADRLNMAYNTLINHTQNIYEKTGVKHSIGALVSWWYCTNFSLNIPQVARNIIACMFLCMIIPRELLSTQDTYRMFRSSRQTQQIVRVKRNKE